jgi:hypothetical protein
VEVVEHQPINAKIIERIPYASFDTTKQFCGNFNSTKGQYPLRFSKDSSFVKLAYREVDYFSCRVSTQDRGIYKLRIAIRYSVAGKEYELHSDTGKDVWFF